MFLICSPAMVDILDIINASSSNGYIFTAPEIID